MDATRYRVPIREIERELNAQMKALQGGSKPLQRARMSNLVIFCTSLEQSILLNEQVPAISAFHPSRTILLVGELDGGDRELTARVTIRPIGPAAKHYSCAEQVTVHAGGTNVERFPFTVRSLVIGDLPVNLWWATPVPPSEGGSLMYDLSENAQQIIYDSLGWRDPIRGVITTSAWLDQIERPGGRWRVAGDLNWRRLKYWRRLLSQSYEVATAPGANGAIKELQIEHGPHAVVQAWLLAGWLTRALNWRVTQGSITPGVEMAWRFITPTGEAMVRIRRLEEGPPEVRRVLASCSMDGKDLAVDCGMEGVQRLSTTFRGIDGAARTITIPPQSPVDLIGRQLSDRARDPVFRESMAVACVMAQSVK
jgi:glucose-6-phosphate dehydrogenase assembly protein OpcA